MAGPYTSLHQLGRGLEGLATVGGVVGLTWSVPDTALELRAEAGLERPYVLGDGARRATGHGGLQVRWALPGP